MSFKVKNVIKASEDAIKKILRKYSDKEYFLLNKIEPIPSQLELILGSHTGDAILYALCKKDNKELQKIQEKLKEEIKDGAYTYDGERKIEYLSRFVLRTKERLKETTIFDLKNNVTKEYLEKLSEKAESYLPFPWEAKLGIRTFEELGNLYLNNIIEYDAFCRSDWSGKNWGTTGMAIIYESKGDTLVIETEWSSPIKIIEKISDEFPNITFSVEFASNGDDSCGKYEIKNGELISYMDLEESDVLRIWNYKIDNENKHEINNQRDDEWEDEMY